MRNAENLELAALEFVHVNKLIYIMLLCYFYITDHTPCPFSVARPIDCGVLEHLQICFEASGSIRPFLCGGCYQAISYHSM